MYSDLYIAQHSKMRPVQEIAEQLGLTPDDMDLYGSPYIAKLRLSVLDKLKDRPTAKYIDVWAITPTPLGEGKSTTLIGLGEAMKHLGKKAVVSLRKPKIAHLRRPRTADPQSQTKTRNANAFLS